MLDLSRVCAREGEEKGVIFAPSGPSPCSLYRVFCAEDCVGAEKMGGDGWFWGSVVLLVLDPPTRYQRVPFTSPRNLDNAVQEAIVIRIYNGG
jgi:hypothetical protein